MVWHTYNMAFVDWGRETETPGWPGINSELQMSVFSSGTVPLIKHELLSSNCRTTKTNYWALAQFFDKSQSQSLILVILGCQEAEIRRFVVQSQHMQNFHQTLSEKNWSEKKGWRTASSSKSTCLASMTLSVQYPGPHPEKIGFQEFGPKPFAYAYSHSCKCDGGDMWIHMCISVWYGGQ
jgi:hypothetical protein